MAMIHSAHCADNCCELANTRLRLTNAMSLRSTISVVILAMGLAGCAREPAPHQLNLAEREVKATHVRPTSHARVKTETQQHVELRVHRPDAALLVPQPAPNCEFKRTDVKSVDPDEWARLKAEYERQCYQDAEKAARDRLRQLQASSTCEVERVPQLRPVRLTHARPRSRLEN